MPTEVESDMNLPHQAAFDIDLNIDPLWCSWFSGWVDGEGCFTPHVSKRTRSIQGRILVCVREDDAELVRGVRETLKCGIVDQYQSRGHNRMIRWICYNVGSCRNILIPLFDAYPLRSKKRRDYDIWRKLVLAISEDHHLNGNREYVLDLCRQLHDIKKYVP